MTFKELGLGEEVLKALEESGYTEPTPIQAGAIPEALAGKDVLGIAQTGTGKTASFTLPMIERLSKGRAKARMPRSLVLCPTRELAAQVAENFEKYGKYHKLTMALLIGGVSFKDQEMKLDRGVDVLIATPGRLLDHFERGKLLMTGVQIMVVDEADRMLDMGFIPDIERIFKLTPFTRQTLFFSATMPDEIVRITNQFLSAPVRVEVSKPSSTASTITQKIIRVPRDDARCKRVALRKIIDESGVKNGIIFCNRKKTVDVLAKSLQKYGYNARPIHGDLPQAYRMETLAGFRAGEIQLLIASDVAARGLDIPDVSHVFNFDVPIHAEDYVHRIGRTGRAGREGAAFMLVCPEDRKFYDAILKEISKDTIEEEELDPAIFEGVEDRPRRERSTRSRDGGRRERGGRSRRREREDRPEETTDQPIAEIVEAVADEQPREERAEREPRPARERPQRERQPRRRRERDEDGGERVVAFGGHTPDFLLREVPVKRKASSKSETAAA